MYSILFLIKYTPWWVWLALAWVLYAGITSLRPNTVFLPRLLIVPVAVLLIQAWSASFFFYVTCLACGLVVGWHVAMRTPIEMDKSSWSVKVPGTYATLFLLLLLFCEKYFMGFMRAVRPFAARKLLYFDLSVSAFIAGYFLGRAIYFGYRWYRQND